MRAAGQRHGRDSRRPQGHHTEPSVANPQLKGRVRLCAPFRALAAHHEARQLGKELGAIARVVAPALLAQPGVGPVTGAQVLISWSHPGRLRSEAAFAMLAGAARSRRPWGGWSAIG